MLIKLSGIKLVWEPLQDWDQLCWDKIQEMMGKISLCGVWNKSQTLIYWTLIFGSVLNPVMNS